MSDVNKNTVLSYFSTRAVSFMLSAKHKNKQQKYNTADDH